MAEVECRLDARWPPGDCFRMQSRLTQAPFTLPEGDLRMFRVAAVVSGVAALLLTISLQAAEIDWSKVDEAIGKKGAAQPGGVYKYGLPRSDLQVTVDGVALKPSLALGSWVAFLPAGEGAMVMGDLVLTETELSPVMKRLIDEGFDVSAV